MKTFLIFIASFSFTIVATGQDSLGFTNKAEAKNLMVNGLKEGKWVEYLDIDGHVISYADGVKLDSIRRMDTNIENMISYRLTIYKNGKPYGIVKEFYDYGDLFSETLYVDGKENGLQNEYYETGALEWQTSFKDGKLNGQQKAFTEHGQQIWESSYLNDTLDGIQKWYHENGKLKSETLYLKGVPGTTKNYDENGNVIK